MSRTGYAALAVLLLVAGIALGYLFGASRSSAKTAVAPSASPTTVTVQAPPETVTVTRNFTSTVTRTVVARVVKYTLADALGRVVTLTKPPSRVVSLAPSITEDLCALNLCSRLVGVDDYSKTVEGVPANVTVVGGFWQPSAEKIVQLKPDLVLACSGVPSQERMARQLSQLGVKLFFLRCDRSRSIDDVFWDINALGLIFNVTDRAEKLVSELETRLEEVSSAVANETRPTVALIVYPSDKGAWVAGGGTFQDDALSRAGAKNVFGKTYGWGMVGFEELLAKNPDYIIVTVQDKSGAARVEKLFETTPLARLKAYREGHVCVLYGDATNKLMRPSPGIVDAVQLLAAILHPGKVEPPANLAGDYICIGVKG